MGTIEKVFGHRFRVLWPIAVLTVSLDDVLTQFRMEPESWFEDGLGPARGVVIRLPSERVVLIQEFEYAPKHFGASELNLEVDGADVVSFGVSALVDEVISALGLSQNAVAWKASEDSRQSVGRILGSRPQS